MSLWEEKEKPVHRSTDCLRSLMAHPARINNSSKKPKYKNRS